MGGLASLKSERARPIDRPSLHGETANHISTQCCLIDQSAVIPFTGLPGLASTHSLRSETPPPRPRLPLWTPDCQLCTLHCCLLALPVTTHAMRETPCYPLLQVSPRHIVHSKSLRHLHREFLPILLFISRCRHPCQAGKDIQI